MKLVFTRVLSKMSAATLVSAAALAGSAGQAEAQFFFSPFYGRMHYYQAPHRPYFPQQVHPAEEMTPREIVGAVSRQGFRDVSKPRYEDDVAVLTARGRDGRRMMLEVDVFSGRIVGGQALRQPPPERRQLVQRAPDQGAAVRRGVPEQRRDVRTTPDAAPGARPPTTVRREPLLPPQPQQSRPAPRTEPKPQPPTAQQAQPGTRTAPRRIDITPPAALDDAAPVRPPAAPPGPPINSVPPAGLE